MFSIICHVEATTRWCITARKFMLTLRESFRYLSTYKVEFKNARKIFQLLKHITPSAPKILSCLDLMARSAPSNSEKWKILVFEKRSVPHSRAVGPWICAVIMKKHISTHWGKRNRWVSLQSGQNEESSSRKDFSDDEALAVNIFHWLSRLEEHLSTC